MRFLGLFGVALALGGCSNMVFSDKPLFSRLDSQGAPTFRPGVWLAADDACAVDSQTSVQTWPDCALPLIYGRRGLKAPDRTIVTRVVAGEPLILQQSSRDVTFYNALRPLAVDESGQVTAYETWAALCGPPRPPQDPAPGETPAMSAGLTLDLLPGLDAAEPNCRARDPGAVRNAAAKSRAWAKDPIVFRWVRAQTRGDHYRKDPSSLATTVRGDAPPPP